MHPGEENPSIAHEPAAARRGSRETVRPAWRRRRHRGREGRAHRFSFDKAFHVSPFMSMAHRYHWRLSVPGERLHVVMRNEARGRVVFSAALAMQARPFDRRHLTAALARHPWMTATVLGGIYWQALRLALKGVRFHPHPKHRVTQASGR